MQKTVNISLLLIFVLLEIAFADPKVKSNVSAKLLTSQNLISSGDEITLAVEFIMKNNWHIYWENPGDAGMATTLEFILPDGFQAGKVLYPFPVKFTTEGLTSFGYKNKAVLLTKISVPDHLKVNQDYKIKVKALWLECKDICVPGETELEVTLKAVNKDKTKKINPFNDYKRNIPKTLSGLESNVNITEQSANLKLIFPDYLDRNSLNFDIFPLNEAIFAHSKKPKITKNKNTFFVSLDFDPFKVEIPELLEFIIILDDNNAKIINSKSIYLNVQTR